MSKYVLRIAMLLLAATSLGCAASSSMPVKPPPGWLVSSYKAPLTIDLNGNPCGPATKSVSESSVSYFRDFLLTGLSFAFDEATISRIARKGGIEHVSFADYEVFTFLGIYAKTTIIVYGN